MAPKKQKTRHSSGNIFGPSAELPDDGELFTMRDILAAAERHSELNPDANSAWVAAQLFPAIKKKWKCVNPEMPIHSDDVVKKKIERILDRAKLVRQKKASTYQKNLLISRLDKLFDLLICQCDISPCEAEECSSPGCSGAHISCECLREEKIPVMELVFIHDQRSKVGHTGKMQMGRPDLPETSRKQDNRLRKEKEKLGQELLKTKNQPSLSISNKPEDNVEKDSVPEHPVECDEDSGDEDPEFIISSRTGRSSSCQNRVNIMPYIAEVERYFVSDRAASALWNAALRCTGAITMEDTKNVVDKCKIVRGKAAYRAVEKQKQREKISSEGGLKCVGVDGKRDKKTKTIVNEVINGKRVEKKKVATVEHISYTVEPPGDYLTHSVIPPGRGTGRDLANDFIDVIAENASTDTLEAIVADGKAVNTGWKDGFKGHVERDLRATLLHLICMLHGNELDFRHLFCYCEGGPGTSGPDSFKGPVGTQCKEQVHPSFGCHCLQSYFNITKEAA